MKRRNKVSETGTLNRDQIVDYILDKMSDRYVTRIPDNVFSNLIDVVKSLYDKGVNDGMNFAFDKVDNLIKKII